MADAHLYFSSDACPSDWLVAGQDDTWHTIVNFVFQSDPSLQSQVESGHSHIDGLSLDRLFNDLVTTLQAKLPSRQLRKWSTGPSYRTRFCQAFKAIQPEYKPIVSACSFQEKTLRASKVALIHSYNEHIGGIEGRGIGFEEFTDGKGRLQMKHSFLNFHGYHEIQAPESQMLVLLLMSWFIADQYVFYRKDIVTSKRYEFNRLGITIVSDKLSGDDDFRRKSELNLRNLIDPDGQGVPIVLTRSPQSDTYQGDLLADNLAGFLNAAISDPGGEFAQHAIVIAPSGVWTGWYVLLSSQDKLQSVPALSCLTIQDVGTPNASPGFPG
jgi:hypothetical protein